MEHGLFRDAGIVNHDHGADLPLFRTLTLKAAKLRFECLQGDFWNKRIGTVSKLNRVENGPDRDIVRFGLLSALYGRDADYRTWSQSVGQLH